ncbi:endonuclease/exonuclease/phosphatase family protein [Neobacillus drentensis]|uniref:endonuclease/exonuclease/phosphatase family protein n=1 Tax=Neobacillus drentensis TaxID=220684 RepID=UPI002FFF190E
MGIGKKLWFSLLLLISFTFLIGSNSYAMGEFTQGRQVNVKIMTYNIQAGAGSDGKYDIKRTAETIRQSGADIIALQEVDVHWGARSLFENDIEILANELDMYYFFTPIYSLDPLTPGDPRREFGVAILSKYPILEANNREITRLSTQEANPVPKPAPGFLEALINVKGAKVWFYVTHLDYRADPTVRKMQVADMLNITGQHEYSILAGDMNAGPNAPELQPLFEKYNDAWALTNVGPGLTYPANNPSKRIDYILLSPQMEARTSEVIETLASDHRPVIAEITLKRGNKQ